MTNKLKDAGASIAGNVTGPPDRRKPESNPTNYWANVQKDLNKRSQKKSVAKKGKVAR